MTSTTRFLQELIVTLEMIIPYELTKCIYYNVKLNISIFCNLITLL